MTSIDLTRRNAHRVATVKSKANPERGELKFNYYARQDGYWKYHTIGEGEEQEVVPIAKLSEYEVCSFLYEDVTLDEFWSAAYSAFSWTSFDPEKRQEQCILDHEKELRADLADMPEEYKEKYISDYKQFFGAMLSASSRCASAAIAGPAKFNHNRNNKAHSTYEKRCNEFWDWRKKKLAYIEKSIEKSKPQEQRDFEAWEDLKESIASSASTILAIDKGKSPYSRPLFVSSIYNKVLTHAGHGSVDVVDRAVAFIRELNGQSPKPIITERHKFFKLPEVARAVKAKKEEIASRENKELSFNGFKVVWNYEIDRIQIIFDQWPGEDMHRRLTREFAFNYSRRNSAYQRKPTANTEWAVKKALNITF